MVMHRPPLLKLCHPQIAARNAVACAMPPVLLRGRADVVGAPVIHAGIGQGDHPGHGRPAPMIGQAMQVTGRPNRAPEPFHALFLGVCLIEKDLKGTCFRWDKPSGAGFAGPRPRRAALRLPTPVRGPAALSTLV